MQYMRTVPWTLAGEQCDCSLTIIVCGTRNNNTCR